MEAIAMDAQSGCASCKIETTRRMGGQPLCLECEMKDLAAHCARVPGLVIRDVLEGYLGRPARDEEAEAFTRHYLEAAEARSE